MSNRVCVGLVLVGLAGWATAASARAADTTFTIDSSRSSLTLSGSAFSHTGDPPTPLVFEEQGPGSLTTTLTGDLVADLGAGSIALTGGTWTLVNSEEWLPGPAPANFGFQADSMNALIGSMTGAVRNGVMTPSAASATTTPMPNGFEFPADGLVLTGQGGTVDLDGQPDTSLLGALAGLQVPLAGVTSSQTIPPVPAGTYTNVAGVETLTLPVHVLFADFVPTSDVEWQLDGTVVAVRGVPEPTSLALLALSGAAVLARRRV